MTICGSGRANSPTKSMASLSIPKGALRDAVFATKDFVGLTGTLSCTPTGDCGAPVIAVYQITQADVDALKMPSTPIWPK